MTTSTPEAAAELLARYDEQLRTNAEVLGAAAVARVGPLFLAELARGRGFVTYRDLGGADAAGVAALVAAAVAHYAPMGHIRQVEWKTRGHDVAPGLETALIAAGFAAEPTESVMIGRAEDLVRDGAASEPAGIEIERITSRGDVREASAMQGLVFGDAAGTDELADVLVTRLAAGNDVQLWVARAGGAIVSAGRLDAVPGTDFAGIWGGATLPEWRGRGIYRALTARRAAAALELGRTLVHSDSTEFSRPILERSGFTRVTTTTPYLWRREAPGS